MTMLSEQSGFSAASLVPWFAWEPMEAGMRIDDRIRKTVAFIGRADTGPFVAYGTGFFTLLKEGQDEGWQTLVTAKHVIDKINSETISVRLNDSLGSAKIVNLKKADWLFHPDPRVDVAVCPTNFTKDMFDISHIPLDERVLSDETAQKYNIGGGDDVYVAGLYTSRPGGGKIIPIVRCGTIAAMADEPIKTEYGYHDAFLVEMMSTDGLSGSPACVYLSVARSSSDAKFFSMQEMLTTNTYLFMGMVLGHGQVTNPGDDIQIIPDGVTDAVPKEIGPLNTGIAVVLPVWKIAEAVQQPEMRQRRAAAAAGTNNRRFVPD